MQNQAAIDDSQPVDVDAREPWQRVAEDDMGLRVTRPSPHHVQFRSAETNRMEADWWPSKGTLHIYVERVKGQRPDVLGSTGNRDGMEVVRMLQRA